MDHLKNLRMRRIARFVWILAPLLFLIASWNCKDSISGSSGSDIVFPDSNISYAKYVEPLFLSTCAIPGCHTEADMDNAGGISFETYQDALSVPLIIIPKDTTNSQIVWSLEATHGRPRMPPIGRPALTNNQINGLKRWIWEGAKNN